MLLKKYVV
jgi:hypothetical protein